MRGLLTASLLLTLSVAACSDSRSEPLVDTPVAFETVVQEQSTGVVGERQQVISDAAAWATVWSEIWSGINPSPPLPQIDFGRDVLILAARGQSRDGCRHVEITSVRVNRQQLEVDVLEIENHGGCACPALITHPVHVVRIPRQDVPPTYTISVGPRCPGDPAG